MRKFSLLLTLIILCSIYLKSQDLSVQLVEDVRDNKIYLGIAGGLNYIWNETNIRAIPLEPGCGEYKNGEDFGYFAGITGGYELFKDELAEKLAAVEPIDPLDTRAEITAMNRQAGEGLYQFIKSRMDNETIDLTAPYRGSGPC